LKYESDFESACFPTNDKSMIEKIKEKNETGIILNNEWLKLNIKWIKENEIFVEMEDHNSLKGEVIPEEYLPSLVEELKKFINENENVIRMNEIVFGFNKNLKQNNISLKIFTKMCYRTQGKTPLYL